MDKNTQPTAKAQKDQNKMIGTSYIVRGGKHEQLLYLAFGRNAKEAWTRVMLLNPTVTAIKTHSLSAHNDLYAAMRKRGWQQGEGWTKDYHDPSELAFYVD